MEVVDYILEGLEAELALERELGIRLVECDRSIFTPTPPPPPPPPFTPTPTPTVTHYSYIFLHDRPLSPAGNEMMAKIIVALGKTAETAPIIIEKPVPKAEIYVVLGGLALRKFQPNMKGAPGQWLTTEKGARVLVTYSPEYILRFKEVTPAVKKIKEDMWRTLKQLKGLTKV